MDTFLQEGLMLNKCDAHSDFDASSNQDDAYDDYDDDRHAKAQQ